MEGVLEMKGIVRKKMIEKRKEMPREEVIAKSRVIKEKVKKMKEFRSARNVMFYVSYNNEVFTHDLIKESFSEKRVIVPLLLDDEIVPVEIREWKELKPGAFNILEPEHRNLFPLHLIDLVLVPGVVFDEKGYRIGHGLGYYDKFLKKLRATRIGLAFDFQVVKEVPHLEYDQRMDIIVTDKRILDCRE